ncbi:MAG: acyl-CoA dehydratase activase [Dehalococcoidia bacterium]
MEEKAPGAQFRIGFPNMGVYGHLGKKVVGDILKELRVDAVSVEIAPPTTKKTVQYGSQQMDENMCLPAKITMGNILELADSGVDAVLEWDSCGECRQKTYYVLHKTILKRSGHQTTVIPMRFGDFKNGIEQLRNKLTKKQFKFLMREALRRLWDFDLRMMKKQSAAPEGAPRIGICGEIYTILEPSANLDLIANLEKQGAFVHNALPLSQWLFRDLFKGKNRLGWSLVLAALGMWREIKDWCLKRLRRPDVDYELLEKAEREAEKYLPLDSIGGHGKESIIWAIYYALAGFDGVIHIMPFPCMPEATVSILLDEVSRDYNIPINHLVFDQQFGEQNLITRAEATVNMLRFRKEGLDSILGARKPGVWLGVDVGSTSTKAVLLDGAMLEVIDSEYQFTNRAPIETLKKVLEALKRRNPTTEIVGIAATGSGRRLAKALLDAPLAVDEITCQVTGSMLYAPQTRSIIEIGGQDSKFISLDERGIPMWFNMNSICSAGTGAFLGSAARAFNVPVEEIGCRTRCSKSAVTITGRCGVFAESDIVSKQQAGYPPESILKGMCTALSQNFLTNVCRSRKLEGPVLFTGGVALNEGVEDAFSEILGTKMVVHPHAKISGALGAALVAMAREARGGLGLALSQMELGTKSLSCHDCSNQCEVSVIHRDGSIVASLGSKCGKWDTLIGRRSSAGPVAELDLEGLS